MQWPEPTLWWLGYAAIGAFVGTFAGMLGIGGGLMIIPLLALAFEGQGIAREHVLHLAVGTAMATIALTSLSSMRAHASRKAVRWEIARSMTPGILLGSLAGAHVAKMLSTRALAVYFAVFVFALAINMALNFKPKPARGTLGAPGMFAAGFVISGLSALIAMGGAALTVPLMLYMQVPMIQAIGTAAAIGFPIALGGTAGYLATGWGDAGLPPWSVGYVYLPALAGIAAASVVTAPFGAQLAHRLPARTLRLVFAVLLFVLATRMLVSLW
jgi:uncharacterized membrane protein YfcA